jgi:hypothetical protein
VITVPTIQVRADLSAEELLRAAGQLEPAELDTFVANLLKLRARQQGRCLGPGEDELLRRINQGLTPPEQARVDALLAKRDTRTLTPEEHQELIRLSDRIEALQADRAAALIDLARLRQVSLEALLGKLGIPPADHG